MFYVSRTLYGRRLILFIIILNINKDGEDYDDTFTLSEPCCNVHNLLSSHCINARRYS